MHRTSSSQVSMRLYCCKQNHAPRRPAGSCHVCACPAVSNDVCKVAGLDHNSSLVFPPHIFRPNSCPTGNQASLMELLEVPQLMDTCVRNGVYDEALDLQAFISRVGLLHPDVPVVKLLLTQVGGCE